MATYEVLFLDTQTSGSPSSETLNLMNAVEAISDGNIWNATHRNSNNNPTADVTDGTFDVLVIPNASGGGNLAAWRGLDIPTWDSFNDTFDGYASAGPAVGNSLYPDCYPHSNPHAEVAKILDDIGISTTLSGSPLRPQPADEFEMYASGTYWYAYNAADIPAAAKRIVNYYSNGSESEATSWASAFMFLPGDTLASGSAVNKIIVGPYWRGGHGILSSTGTALFRSSIKWLAGALDDPAPTYEVLVVDNGSTGNPFVYSQGLIDNIEAIADGNVWNVTHRNVNDDAGNVTGYDILVIPASLASDAERTQWLGRDIPTLVMDSVTETAGNGEQVANGGVFSEQTDGTLIWAMSDANGNSIGHLITDDAGFTRPTLTSGYPDAPSMIDEIDETISGDQFWNSVNYANVGAGSMPVTLFYPDSSYNEIGEGGSEAFLRSFAYAPGAAMAAGTAANKRLIWPWSEYAYDEFDADGVAFLTSSLRWLAGVLDSGAPLAVNAGTDDSELIDTDLALNGSASGGVAPYSYAWTVTSSPGGSTTQFSNAAIAAPNFQADIPGVYTLRLTVTDDDSTVEFDEVDITLSAPTLTANSGADDSVETDTDVALSGSGNGGYGAYTYAWTVVSSPGGSTPVFSAPSAAATNFQADVAGSYTLRLTVTDSLATDATDDVIITVTEPPPDPLVVDAGSNRAANVDTNITLAGSVSGGTTPYTNAWTVTSSPGGSTPVFGDDTSLTSTFQADIAGVYTLQLTVTDSGVQVENDSMTVTLTDPPPDPVFSGNRLALQSILENITPNVYFQPPPSLQMQYPCIVYNRSNIRTEYANDLPYTLRNRYQVTVIDRDPDSLIPNAIASLPTARHDRFYVTDNLNHDVFQLFF